ncbi:hypothetical protein, partial [Desulfonatronum sp. SC1]|uniref:hypothetical protein n=1 Tax=Desulfonatronum sp. SC1 TaxID=2109626 RepID=UPI0018EEBA52
MTNNKSQTLLLNLQEFYPTTNQKNTLMMKKTFISLMVLIVAGFGFQNLLLAQDCATPTPLGRVVEDGGTGAYSAIMYTDSTLKTHTIFRPRDLKVFGTDNK